MVTSTNPTRPHTYSCSVCDRGEDTKAHPPVLLTICADCPTRSVKANTHSVICSTCIADGYTNVVGPLDFNATPISMSCYKCKRHANLKYQDAVITAVRARCSPEVIGALALDRCPWMAQLRQATPEELRLALRYLKRHRAPHEDRLDESLWTGKDGPNLGTTMAVLAAASVSNAPPTPAQKTAGQCVEALRMNNAPHMTYRKLFLSAGANIDTATAYFARVAAESNRPLTAALAQERVFLRKVHRALFSPYLSNNKNRPPPDMAAEGMAHLYDLCRTMSRMIKDASRQESEDLQVFEACYGYLMKYSLKAPKQPVAVKSRSRSPARGGGGGRRNRPNRPRGGGQPTSAPTTPPVQLPPPKRRSRSPRRDGRPAPHKQGAAKPPFPHVKAEFGALTAEQELALDRLKKVPQALRDKRACINCFVRTGKIGEAHSFLECKSLGNPCLVPCKFCLPGPIFHYRADCPNARKP